MDKQAFIDVLAKGNVTSIRTSDGYAFRPIENGAWGDGDTEASSDMVFHSIASMATAFEEKGLLESIEINR